MDSIPNPTKGLDLLMFCLKKVSSTRSLKRKRFTRQSLQSKLSTIKSRKFQVISEGLRLERSFKKCFWPPLATRNWRTKNDWSKNWSSQTKWRTYRKLFRKCHRKERRLRVRKSNEYLIARKLSMRGATRVVIEKIHPCLALARLTTIQASRMHSMKKTANTTMILKSASKSD